MTSTEVQTDDNDMCGICLEEFNSLSPDNIIVTLKCNHKYCYECIYDSYINNKEKRQCPYCRKNGGYLPLPESETPTKYIHKEYVSSKLPALPLYYNINHYKKNVLVQIASKIGVPLLNKDNKKKLKKELYLDINLAYNNDKTIIYKY
tara:strand:- start:772 stop:1215 length:444 start_codon:yes stop_codon:yes gene_type:complete